MLDMAFAAHSLSPAERKAMLAAESRGEAFLVYRDGFGDLRFAYLGERERVVIGRVAGNDVVLDWDPKVSRTHAQLERLGDAWRLVDDGLSRNGSHVNDQRVNNRRRLSDGDVVRLGQTAIVFRTPGAGFESTLVEYAPLARVTEAEYRVLVALCAPFASDSGPAPAPASNRDIADALGVSLDSVKTHVRSLFTKLGVGDLPQYQKRTELARRALERGLVKSSDLLS